MNIFLLYELICAVIFILVLVIKKKFNMYLLLFIMLFFLLTYIIIPYFDLHLVIHRYIIRGISTVVAGLLAFAVYKVDIKSRKQP